MRIVLMTIILQFLYRQSRGYNPRAKTLNRMKLQVGCLKIAHQQSFQSLWVNSDIQHLTY